ncbi:MAG: DUF502 domain-containing protein [Planctomycetota bacterium]
MPSPTPNADDANDYRSIAPFRRAVVRGLGVLLPPLLTLVIFLWVGGSVVKYLLVPLEDSAEYLLIASADIRQADEFPAELVAGEASVVTLDDEAYRRLGGEYVPVAVYEYAKQHAIEPLPETARGVYRVYVRQKWLQRRFVIPIFLCFFILTLYLLGKFLAAGIGRFFWSQFEALIDRLPLVRNVYSSVKQVTDFLFTDPDLEYTRVVAIEYPRKGIWTVAFVTGESMLDIESAANESVMSVLVATSPMPFTGFTMTVKKSETVDLDLSIDQAFQFIVSCGVVVPPQQLTKAVRAKQAAAEPAASRGDLPPAIESQPLAARVASDE